MIMMIIAALCGVFCIVCAATDQDWFFNNYKAAPFVKWFGREGARRFYIGLGIFILVVAVIGMIV